MKRVAPLINIDNKPMSYPESKMEEKQSENEQNPTGQNPFTTPTKKNNPLEVSQSAETCPSSTFKFDFFHLSPNNLIISSPPKRKRYEVPDKISSVYYIDFPPL